MFELILVGLFLVCFASCGAQALTTFSRHRLEELCEKYRTPKRLGVILKNYERVASAAAALRVILAQSVVVYLVLGVFARMVNEPGRIDFYPDGIDAVKLNLLGSLLLLAAIIWVPFPLVKLWGTPFVYFTWPLWHLTAFVLYPLELVNRFVKAIFCRLAGYTADESEEDAFEEEIRTIVTEGHREGLLEEDAREMIEGVIELSDVSVSEIMTPRTDMICISKTLTWEEMLQQVIPIPHSRIPVYDTNRDDIIGVLIAKDLLPELARQNPKERLHWTELMNEPYFVPETRKVGSLLQTFQKMPRPYREASKEDSEAPANEPTEWLGHPKAHSHLAIVLDEYGGVSGLVTLEDILEEIVGDIVDEHDPVIEQEDIRTIDASTFDVLGRVHIDELNEQLDLDLPEDEDFDTIAGLIFSTLGRVPRSGEMLSYGKERPLRFTVLEATNRRIELVRIERNIGRENKR